LPVLFGKGAPIQIAVVRICAQMYGSGQKGRP
jgi:hypothetical protein